MFTVQCENDLRQQLALQNQRNTPRFEPLLLILQLIQQSYAVNKTLG